MAPVRGPPGSFAPVPISRAAELASLRQSSPPKRCRDRGAATPEGAGTWRDYEENDTGSPIKSGMTGEGVSGMAEKKKLQIPHCVRNDHEEDGTGREGSMQNGIDII